LERLLETGLKKLDNDCYKALLNIWTPINQVVVYEDRSEVHHPVSLFVKE
jgi:hypothetical protein